MHKINFSNAATEAVFANHDYASFSQLMLDTAKGAEKVSKEEANKKIREVMFEVLGIDENSTRREIHKAIRRHKIDIFEVIEETVENLLISGWGENPFFREFVEMKSFADGDTNIFFAPTDVILTVAEVSGNHHDLFRQRIGGGKTFAVKTSWYGIKIYTEYELFMAGRVDWSTFVQKIYEAFDKKVNDMLYSAVMAAGDKIVPQSQFVKTGALTTEAVITLVDDIQRATGEEVVIMGTKSALAALNALEDIQWVSEDMKDERHTTGKIGVFMGIRLVEIPQAYAPNTTSSTLVDNKKLLFMPTGDNRFIKLYNEGEAQVKEVSDGTTNMDATMEYEYQMKMGLATIIGKLFGVWTLD